MILAGWNYITINEPRLSFQFWFEQSVKMRDPSIRVGGYPVRMRDSDYALLQYTVVESSEFLGQFIIDRRRIRMGLHDHNSLRSRGPTTSVLGKQPGETWRKRMTTEFSAIMFLWEWMPGISRLRRKCAATRSCCAIWKLFQNSF